MKVFTSKKMHEMDAIASQEYQIPLLLLMDSAARALMDKIMELKVTRPLIICGSGNNGGDGFALASLLKRFTVIEPTIIFCSEANLLSDEARTYFEMCQAMHLRQLNQPGMEDLHFALKKSDLVVDCLLGSGCSRNVEGYYYDVIETINEADVHVLSCDIASGLHADSGKIMAIAIRAKWTVTFEYLKPAHYLGEAALYSGKVSVAKIGIPKGIAMRLKPEMELLEANKMVHFLPVRYKDSNKATYGKVLVIGGSQGMSGALKLCVKACLKMGCGLVTYATVESLMPVMSEIDEAMSIALSEIDGHIDSYDLNQLLMKAEKMDVIAVGCGLGRSHDSVRLIEALLKLEKPMVIDADGLWALCELKEQLKIHQAPLILTPHLIEFMRLCNCEKADMLENYYSYAKAFVKEYPVTLVLKGMHTLIMNKDKIKVSSAGNNGLSKGGSGDVLCGMITGLLAQKLSALNAASLGVYLHGSCADSLKEKIGVYAMQPSDVISQIAYEMQKLENFKEE